MVATLDRLIGSPSDLSALIGWFEAAQGVLVILEPKIDSSADDGKALLSGFARLAQWNRAVIAIRTREALSAARRAGKPISRPAVADRPACS